MICQACQHDVSEGDIYIVKFGSERTEYLSSKLSRVHRGIAGSRQVFICDDCVNRFIKKRGLLGWLGVALLSALSSLFAFISSKPLAGQISPIILGLAVGAFLFHFIDNQRKPGKGRQQMGDLLAIQLMKPGLKLHGYSRFFTRRD